MSLQKNEIKPLGYFPAWFYKRFFILLLFTPFLLRTQSLTFLGVAVLLTIVRSYLTYEDAFGYADEKGITFRRFFRKYRVPWDDVARVDWSTNLWKQRYIEITLEHRVGFFRKVMFSARDKTYQWGKPPSEDWVPEILPWMMNQLRMNQPPST